MWTDFFSAGTGTPVRGGLTFREGEHPHWRKSCSALDRSEPVVLTIRAGHYITEAVAETGCLVALDIMVSSAALT